MIEEIEYQKNSIIPPRKPNLLIEPAYIVLTFSSSTIKLEVVFPTFTLLDIKSGKIS